jgi:hypothetical protein
MAAGLPDTAAFYKTVYLPVAGFRAAGFFKAGP